MHMVPKALLYVVWVILYYTELRGEKPCEVNAFPFVMVCFTYLMRTIGAIIRGEVSVDNLRSLWAHYSRPGNPYSVHILASWPLHSTPLDE